MKNEGKLVFFAYRGVTGFLHQGHLRGSLYADFAHRYFLIKKQKSFFRSGLHATGSGLPLVFNKKDTSAFKDRAKNFLLLDKLELIKDEAGILKFFKKVYALLYKKLKIKIAFPLITTLEKDYSYFIKKQYEVLDRKGYLIEKEYFGATCLNCGIVQLDAANTEAKSSAQKYTFNLKKIGNLYVRYIPGRGEPKLLSASKTIEVVKFKRGHIEKKIYDNLIYQLKNKSQLPSYKISLTDFKKSKVPFATYSNRKYFLGVNEEKYCILSSDATCKCGEPIFIKKYFREKFIDYSSPKAKKLLEENIGTLKVFPEFLKKELVDLAMKFPARVFLRNGRIWRGTKYKNGTIESISDSTIYPAYYLLKKISREENIPFRELCDLFFSAQDNEELLETKIMKEFVAQYNTINIVGKEHLHVHLRPYLLTHAMILNKKLFRKEVLIHHYIVNKNKEKLSKSEENETKNIEQIANTHHIGSLRILYAISAEYFKDSSLDFDALRALTKKIMQMKNILLTSNSNSTKEVTDKLKLVNYYFKIYSFRKAFHLLMDICSKSLSKRESSACQAFLRIYDPETFSSKKFLIKEYQKDISLLDLIKPELKRIYSKKIAKKEILLPYNIKKELIRGIKTPIWPIKEKSNSYYKKEFCKFLSEIHPEIEFFTFIKKKDNTFLNLYNLL